MKRERESREVWAKRVERWKDSGLVCAEFCAEIDVNPRTLLYWAWRLRKDGKASAGKAKRVEAPRSNKAMSRTPSAPRKRSPKAVEPTFVELVTAPTSSTVEAIEIVVRSVTVRVPPTAAADIVRRAFDLAEKQK